MSELEILQRQNYKRNRKKWSMIQLIAIIIAAAIALVSFFMYHRIDRTQLIEYVESGDVDYRVQYKANEFFPDEWIDDEKTYISSLIQGMNADFVYNLDTSSDEMKYNYEYVINAKLLIANKSNGTPYYTFEELIVPQKSGVLENQKSLKIKESVSIDYVKYNLLAKSFIETYSLASSASCTLLVTFDVVTQCANNGFENVNQINYSTSLNIPLAVDSVNIHRTSANAEGEIRNLEYADAVNRGFVLTLTVVFAILAVLLSILLAVFMILTKNEDVTYANKVRKILNAYRSFIQQIDGEFNADGYQIVPIKTFNEMLSIRDTIQSPVLMWENSDETMTQFFIPTNTKLLYVFDIKVDNYDQIYGVDNKQQVAEEEPVVEESVVEEPIVVEAVVEENVVEEAVIIEENVDLDEIAEAMATPDVVLDEIDYVADNDEDYEGDEENSGIEVVGVVWPERKKHNKVYRYDPNGEQLVEGDMVLVPTRDAARDRDVIRKAAIAHGNHVIDPQKHPHALKKIIGVIKRRAEAALTPDIEEKQDK